MRILMISIDKGLLGENQLGDVVERHKKYGQFCDELDIVVLCKLGYDKQQLAENVFVWPTNSKSRLFYASNAVRIAQEIYQDSKFDLVVCQDPFLTGLAGLKLKKKLGLKLLVHFHGDFWLNKNWLREKWYNPILLLLSKKIISRADGVRVASAGIKNKLIKSGVRRNKIRVIPTPVSLNRFLTFDQARVDELKQKYPGKNILFVGRLEKEKNLAWFLDVFKKIRQGYGNVEFLIIGEGALNKKLQITSYKLRVTSYVKFVGRVDYNDLTNYYHIADILVLSSLSESFGKVLVEAGAAGLACVATATTGAKEIIQNEKTGFLVPINNKKLMLEKILLLLKDERLAKKMGESAKDYVKKNFDVDLNIKKIVKFWQELVF